MANGTSRDHRPCFCKHGRGVNDKSQTRVGISTFAEFDWLSGRHPGGPSLPRGALPQLCTLLVLHGEAWRLMFYDGTRTSLIGIPWAEGWVNGRRQKGRGTLEEYCDLNYGKKEEGRESESR